MKTIRNILTIIFLSLLVFSCEKDEPNPFIGTWENFVVTVRGSNTTTMVYRSNMTMTFTMVVTVDDEDTTSSGDYNYSYTSTTISVWEDGEQEETTEYIINDTYLVLSPGSDFEITLTKTN
ncbi:MAG: hypothetical protein QNK33_08980 [Bacteroidales bacterium]|nr:hypothetical protein [Bacteroidales bacterium]